MSPVITLLTDFGTLDGYAAAVKGVILSRAADALLVDISHDVPAQNVSAAAFVLSTAYPHFPTDTIHLAVVDPGVGTDRRAIILKTPEGLFVGPDNGIFSYIIARHSSGTSHKLADGRYQVKLKPEAACVLASNPRCFRQPVSHTFHGRDIFAPVAAELYLGASLETFGPPLANLISLPLSEPERVSANEIIGHVIHIDRFGNLITDVTERELGRAREITLQISGRIISGLATNYAESPGLMAIIGSSGYVELAYRGASARDILSARLGDEILIRLK